MKQLIYFVLALLVPGHILFAVTIQDLFDSLKQSPVSMEDNIKTEIAASGKKSVEAHLFPQAGLFAGYGFTSEPTGMLPVPPNNLIKMVQSPGTPQPFSQNIFRLGAVVNLPLFSMSLYSSAKKAALLAKTAEEKQKINLQKNEAALVSLNANLQYIEAMFRSLKHRKQSLQKTKSVVTVMVNSGRAPSTALLKINDALHKIDIAISQLDIKKEEILSAIASMTGIYLPQSVDMREADSLHPGEFAVLRPLIAKKQATEYSLKSVKYRLIPMLDFSASYNHSMAPAYNVDNCNNEDFFSMNILMKIPLFNMALYRAISTQKLRVKLLNTTLKKEQLALSAREKQLNDTLTVLNKQLELYKKSIQNKKKLLAVAEEAYTSNRMTIEDYLQYENKVLTEESYYYKSVAKRWHTIVALAVLYGNTIEEMVK